MREGYIETKIGILPEDWEVIKQIDVATFYNGRAYKLDEWETSGTPVIRLQNLTRTGKDYYYSKLKLPEHQYCNKGDLLYMWSATFGPVWWFGDKAIYHYHIWKIEHDTKRLDSVFHYYLLNDITIRMKNESHGSTMLHVTKGGMEKLLIQLPPLPEQQKIAEILSTADDKIDIIDQRITETQQLKKGLMQRLLSKGIGHTKFKKSPLGDIPESWEQLKLGKLISIKHGFAFAGSNFTTIKNNNVLLTPGNFASNGGIKFDWNKQKYYSGEFPPEYILKEGDLIVAMTDLTRACVILGAPAIIPNSNLKYLHNQRLGLVNIGDLNRLCKNYLFHYFNYSIYRDYLRNSATGTTVSHTSPKTIYEVNLILPPLPEQQKIASILSSVDDKLEVLSEKKINYQELKKGLMQQLLTGKIRVKF